MNAKPSPPVCRSLLLLHHSATHTQAHQRRRSARARQLVLPSVLRGVSRLARCNHTQTMVNEPALAASNAAQLRGWIAPDRAAAALIHTHRFQTRAKFACSVALFQRWALTDAHAGYCTPTPERRAYALIPLSVTRLMQRLGAVKKRGLKMKAAALSTPKLVPL